MGIHIGHSEYEFILIDVTSRSYPDTSDFDDRNWLNTKILVKAGSFSGAINGQIQANELTFFRDELTKLYRSLSGSAKFFTIEEWLLLEIAGDGKGHFALTGEIMDEVGLGNILKFKFDFDQTFMPKVLNDLEKVINAFPVLGKAQTAS